MPMRVNCWLLIVSSLCSICMNSNADEPLARPIEIPPPNFSDSAPAAETAKPGTSCYEGVLSRLRVIPMDCCRLANPSKYPAVVPWLAEACRTETQKSPVVAVQYVEPVQVAAAAAAAPVPAHCEECKQGGLQPHAHFSLFGLARVHTPCPANGVLTPYVNIKGHRTAAEKQACDPFKKDKGCNTCVDKSYLTQFDRPVIEKSFNRDTPNPPRAYKLLAGSQRCDVIIKDPEYTGSLEPTPGLYQPLVPKHGSQTTTPSAEKPKVEETQKVFVNRKTEPKAEIPVIKTRFSVDQNK